LLATIDDPKDLRQLPPSKLPQLAQEIREYMIEVLSKIGELGEITHQSITAEDVSEEYHDAEVRLANMKASQKRLQEFLAKSANMNDMLTLERELERISMDIDRVEGRMRFLREHARSKGSCERRRYN